MTEEERKLFYKEQNYKTFCNIFKDGIDCLKLFLKDSKGMSIDELQKKIQEEDCSNMFPCYTYKYYGRECKSTLKGTITKIINTLWENDAVVKLTNGKWLLKENICIDKNGKITFSDSFLYRQYVNQKLINGAISAETICKFCGEKPSFESVGLPKDAVPVSIEDLELAKNKIEVHKDWKPLIFGRAKWYEQYYKLVAEYNSLKNRYDETDPLFKKYDKLLKEYESRVVELCNNLMDNTMQEIKGTQEYWYKMSPYTFEIEVANLFKDLGYETQVTKASGDGGVDIIIKKDKMTIAVQCKAHKDLIGPNIVREVGGVVKRDKYNQGIIVGLKGFTAGAKEEAKKLNIILLDVYSLIALSKEKYIKKLEALVNKTKGAKDDSIEENFNLPKVKNEKQKIDLESLDWKKVISSNINFVAYDGSHSILFVEFKNGNGKVYCYLNVEEDVFNKLLNADSKGSYLNKYIIPNYKCVDPEKIFLEDNE